MSQTLCQTILRELEAIRLVDPHTHINPHHPASTSLADILGYHYYTELVHAAGVAREAIEDPVLTARDRVGVLAAALPRIANTVQYRWLVDICQRWLGLEDSRIDAGNWEQLFDASTTRFASDRWADEVLEASGVDALFLTNDFDDPLDAFDSRRYIPCLRTDELVFHLGRSEVRARLEACSGIEIHNWSSLRQALEQRFTHFVSRGAKACAISLPPHFSPGTISDGRVSTAIDALLQHGTDAHPNHHRALAQRVFWTLAELCDTHRLPFDLMIGVNRRVYPAGVYQGQDLYDSRVSLIQYKDLFNAFPRVTFPISVLASVTNQELVSYAWIFPNVVTCGHWWYSNTPTYIARDLTARLEAVPQSKQIGYYSDAYKLEFIAPKFSMYRRVLARILAEEFVLQRSWSEDQAIALGRDVLRGNVEKIFGV